MLKGIDISAYQRGMSAENWNGLDFVIVKATEGVGYVSGTLEEFADNVLKAGKMLGLYHFARIDKNDPESEADWFMKSVDRYKNNATLWLDFEPSGVDIKESGYGAFEWTSRFLRRVWGEYGWKCGFYTYKNMWDGLESDCKKYLVDRGPLWLAYYNNDWSSYALSNQVAIHQYTNCGSISGWHGDVDMNVSFYDTSKWCEWIGPISKPEEEEITIPNACQWCIDNGIFVGDGKGNYRWTDALTREEAAVVVQKMYDVLYARINGAAVRDLGID